MNFSIINPEVANLQMATPICI